MMIDRREHDRRVLVTGAGGPAGRAVAAYLRERACHVLAADPQPPPSEPGWLRIPPATSPSFDEALDQILTAGRVGWLVPTMSEELPKVARRREAIRAGDCALFISPAGVVDLAHDKWLTVQALIVAGLGVPRSFVGYSRESLLAALPLPILSRLRVGRGGRGVEIYTREADVPAKLSTERIYQEYLPGEEFDVNVFAEPGGEPSVTAVLRKAALKGGRTGGARTLERVDDSATAGEIRRLAEETVRTLRLEGPVDLDIRRASDGRPLVLQVHARVGANVQAAKEVLAAMVAHWRK